MSVPLTVFYCTKCDFNQSFSYGGITRMYQLPNGNKIYAPQTAGWCTKCNSVELILLGLSSYTLEVEIDNLNKRLADINNNRTGENHLSKFEIDEISRIKKNVEEKENYLSVLNGKTSMNSCVECGSNEVFPFHLSPDGVPWPHATSFAHVNCGGQIKKKYLDIRFHFRQQEVIVSPIFMDYSNNPQEDTVNVTTFHGDAFKEFRMHEEVPVELLERLCELLDSCDDKAFDSDAIYQFFLQAKKEYLQKYPDNFLSGFR